MTPQPDPAGGTRRWLRLPGALLRCSAGVSAIEFAILAPVLVLGAFGTADAGRAIYQRMMIGQALRAGAQLAMVGADEAAIRDALQQVAGANFTLADGADPAAGSLSVTVASYCGCPGAALAQVDCTAVCTDGGAAARFYRLAASKTFDGILLPDFPVAGAIEVVAE